MIRPVIAIDLGARPSANVSTGTADCPVLLAARRWSRWDSAKIVGQIDEWLERWPEADIWCEATFTEGREEKKYLRDVGRKQEAQASYLEGVYRTRAEVKRVPPCYGNEPAAAWIAFGRPLIRGKPANEHDKDALAVALKALIRQGARREVAVS